MTKAIILAAAAIGVYLGFKLYGDRVENRLFGGNRVGNGFTSAGREGTGLTGGANGNGV